MSRNAALASGSGSPVSGISLGSNESRKKIDRNYFKPDIPVKSFKCDFTSTESSTSAKLYISNLALYVVERPGRKKMTTIPFTNINDITQHVDSVEIHLSTETIYKLSNFERLESNVRFLLNFWDMVRKPHMRYPIPAKGGSVGCRTNSSASIFDIQSLLMEAASNNHSRAQSARLPPAGSLASTSNSPSESDSLDGSVRKGTSSSSLAAANNSNRSRSNSSSMRSKQTPISPPNSSVGLVDSQLRRDHTNNSLPAATDLRNRTAQSTPIRQPNTTVHHAPVMVTTASENVKTSIDQQRRSAVLAQPQAGRPHRPPTAMCIPDVTVGSTWSLWPFNFLPFPFSAPPQRFTMVIAYAILIFLLLSTVHLYHRLTISDHLLDRPSTLSRASRLHPPPTNTPSASPQPSVDIPETMRVLDAHLSKMNALISKLADSVAQMTSEFQFTQAEQHPLSDAVPSHPPPT